MSRRDGVPRTDIERVINHYGITEDEYFSNPRAYPLPPRGTGFLNAAGTQGVSPNTDLIVGGIALAFLTVLLFIRPEGK